jgi:hypothetical protein
MKRKLFIGSSKEGLAIATQLKAELNKHFSDWLECVIWDEAKVFSLNKSTLDCLMKASRRFDYGVLVATGDDLGLIKGITDIKPRDNVMLELGLFIGSLGLSRAFVLLEKECKLPTDYNGITVPIYSNEIEGSLEKAINQIVEEIEKTRNSYNLKPIPSSALALGYFENFIQPVAKKALENNLDFSLNIILPHNLSNIDIEKKVYKRNNPSEEISVGGDGSRPIVNRLKGTGNNFWDIPTTLSTLNNLIDKVVHSIEIGVNPEKNDWIGYELRNFKGTIEVLVEQCKACKGNVSVIWLD